MRHLRPPFAVLLAASQQIYDPQQKNSAQKVAQVVGGIVAKNVNRTGGWKNTCAVRMSYILNHAGVRVPHWPRTVSGADKQWYFYLVKDLITFLNQHWGNADLVIQSPQIGEPELAGRKGLMLFVVDGWGDSAAGHATLWDGSMCYDHCYFNAPGVDYQTKSIHFWGLI